jgi:hypothetical protein
MILIEASKAWSPYYGAIHAWVMPPGNGLCKGD